jgi:hypothetical protein
MNFTEVQDSFSFFTWTELAAGSVFNRGLGIRYVLSFKPTFPQGDAKKPDIVICEPFYCHEQTYITILLDKAIARIQEKRKRPDNLDFKIVGGTLRRNFDVTWSIGDSEKGILDTPDKYTDMISQCTGEIAMYIEQHDIVCNLRILSFARWYVLFRSK